MIVQCAACQTRFKIADEKVTERGVKVRCSKCANTFIVRKEGPPPAPEALPLARAATPKPATRPPSAKADPFAPFKTAELKPSVDPFASSPPSDPFASVASVGDPFAGLGSAPASPAPPRADPFAGAVPGGAADPFGSASSGADPFAAFGAPSVQPAATNELGGFGDPFASLPPAPSPAPRAPGSTASATPSPSADVFNAEATRDASAPSASDPFSGFSLEGPSVPAPASSAPEPAPAAGDPFAGFSLDPPPAPAASPGAGDPGNFDLGGEEPFMSNGPGLDASGKVSEGNEENVFAAPKADPFAFPANPSLAGDDDLPKTVIRQVKWSGGTGEPSVTDPTLGVDRSVEAEVPAPVARTVNRAVQSPARRLRPRPERERRSSSLARALFLTLAGVGLCGAAVFTKLDDDQRKLAPAQMLSALFAPRGGDLVTRDVTNGFFPTAAHRPVFVVQGEVVNRSAKALPGVKVVAHLMSGSTSAHATEVFAGQRPDPEQIHAVVDPAALDALNASLAQGAQPAAAGAAMPFLAVFYDYPEDLTAHTLKLELVAAEPPKVEPPPPPPPVEPAPEPPKPPEPAPKPRPKKGKSSKAQAPAVP